MAIETIAGRYDVLRRLGTGGMGDVWLAEDTLLGRPVAMKFVGERELRETPGAKEILQDEAKTAGRLLGHPQVVSVLDLLDVDTDLHAGPAVIMEYIDGCNLAEWIAVHRKRVDEPTRNKVGLFIALEATEAIQEAHKLGILHRDVKPQNILCSAAGRVKVADFGLARVVEELTRTHTVWGRHTPLYAAPEQWNDEKPDESTDMYQLCATLYHVLAGEPANQGTSLIGLLRWHETGTLTPLEQLVPSLNAKVAKLITEGLSKEPGDRPAPWQVFDAVSGALMKRLRLDVDLTDCSAAAVNSVVQLTDFPKEKLEADGKYSFTFPNALEALREAIGVTLLGGNCNITEVSPAAGSS